MTDGRTHTRSDYIKKQEVQMPLHMMRKNLFAVTGYADDIDKLKGGDYPTFVRSVTGGVEMCPTTGTSHYQCAIDLYSTQRGPAIKKWLPHSHIGVPTNPHALMQYVLKLSSADGEKGTIYNKNVPIEDMPKSKLLKEKPPCAFPTEYQNSSDMLIKIAKCAVDMYGSDEVFSKVSGSMAETAEGRPNTDYKYRVLTIALLKRDPGLVQYMNSALKNHWINYYSVYLNLAIQESDKISSITYRSSDSANPSGSNDVIEDLDPSDLE